MIRPLLGFALALAAESGAASACDSLAGAATRFDRAATPEAREAALAALAEPCDDYTGKASDAIVLRVLADALATGFDPAALRPAFESRRCLVGARRDERYAPVAAASDSGGCPSRADLLSWYDIKADGALVRARPEAGATPLAWLARGAVVERLAFAGEWIRVKTRDGAEGFVHSSLLRPY